MLRNIEAKYRVASLVSVRQAAYEVATERLGELRQLDTYFVAVHGRLKLREIQRAGTAESQLIWYERANHCAARASNYLIAPVPDASLFRELLSQALGVACRVSKTREVLLHENVRIHLDDVQGLGRFVEFEAVLQGQDDQLGYQQLDLLTKRLGLDEADFVGESYMDLVVPSDA